MQEETVRFPSSGGMLEATLRRPADASGIVVFAHGSGSSRFSPRNRFVADALVSRGLATLLVDLLTPAEEAVDQRTAHLRFDIELLAQRVREATEFVRGDPRTDALAVGYFGASTGAAAALMAAAEDPDVAAVVSRGGRPDLAGDTLPQVLAPTLLIVGSLDVEVLELNRAAYDRLQCTRKLAVVPGATHLFEEPGTLEVVASFAGDWFEQYCVQGARTSHAHGGDHVGAVR